MKGRIDALELTMPYLSDGIWPRIGNVLAARGGRPGAIKHITGDINYVAVSASGRLTVLTNHDCAFIKDGSRVRRAVLKYLWLTIPVRRVRFVTTVSHEAKRDLVAETRCDPDKVIVIHNPVKPDFKPSLKCSWPQIPRILQVGAAKNKNIGRLAIALRGILCELVIIGDLRAADAQALRENGIRYTVRVALSQTEIVDEYVNADIVVFASTIEGFGIPIVEANAVGRPVITSNVSAMPEVAGDAACLVNPFDTEDLRRGVLKVINDSDYRNRIVAAGFENVKRFGADAVSQQYFELYRVIGRENGLLKC